MSRICNEASGKIPVVDVGQLGLGSAQEPDDHEMKRVGQEIADAFIDIGFVYFTNHGIPEEQINNLVKAGATFFSLPQDVKNQYPRDPNTNEGYVSVNQEKFDKTYSYELREAFNVRRTDRILPNGPVPDLRPSATNFLDSCKKFTTRILTAMAFGLGLDRNFFVDTHQEICGDNNGSTLRLLHYPPVPPDLSPDTIRCGTHTDYGTITLLFQDDMGGLQVRDRSGTWVSADPIPGTVLVNVGDILQFWTSNKFVATEHRVLIPSEEVRQQKCRRSVVFFIQPDDTVLIKPLNGSSSYQPITTKEHLLKKFSETYGK